MAVNINIPTQVSQTITNGVTAFAPSEDAVFDALALKQDTLTNPVTGTGANGQVSFWTGTGSQSGDNGLFWNNTNKRLGIGTTTPSNPLDVNGTARVSGGIGIGSPTLSSTTIFDTVVSSSSDLLARFWNNGTGGMKLRFVSNTATSQHQWTTGSFFLAAIAANNTIGLDFRVGLNASEAALDSSSRLRILPNGNILVGTTTDAGFRLDVNGTVRVQGDFTLTAGANIVLQTTTGTRIGTATNQRLSLWNATPDVQPTTAITAAAFVANTSGIVDDTATFGGYTMGQVVAALQRIGALA